jgi:BON-like domain
MPKGGKRRFLSRLKPGVPRREPAERRRAANSVGCVIAAAREEGNGGFRITASAGALRAVAWPCLADRLGGYSLADGGNRLRSLRPAWVRWWADRRGSDGRAVEQARCSEVVLGPLSISRSGNNVTLSGDFPDDSAKAVLMKALKGGLGPGVNIVDQIHLNPSVEALDLSNAGPIFKEAASITDFNLSVNGDTVTLAGTAGSADQKNTIVNAPRTPGRI